MSGIFLQTDDWYQILERCPKLLEIQFDSAGIMKILTHSGYTYRKQTFKSHLGD